MIALGASRGFCWHLQAFCTWELRGGGTRGSMHRGNARGRRLKGLALLVLSDLAGNAGAGADIEQLSNLRLVLNWVATPSCGVSLSYRFDCCGELVAPRDGEVKALSRDALDDLLGRLVGRLDLGLELRRLVALVKLLSDGVGLGLRHLVHILGRRKVRLAPHLRRKHRQVVRLLFLDRLWLGRKAT